MRAPASNLLLIALAVTLLAAGCASPRGPSPTGASDPGAASDAGAPLDPADPPYSTAAGPIDPAAPPATATTADPAVPTTGAAPAPVASGPPRQGPTTGRRAQSAMEGMLLGAMIGAQAGPIGAAVGGVSLLVYGAITGNVPLTAASSSGGGRRRGSYPRGADAEDEEEIEAELGREVARSSVLEDEIEAELRRQEELLERIERNESLREAGQSDPGPTVEELQEEANGTRRAPPVEPLRELPASIFDASHVQREGRALKAHSLDADRDGAPEEIRLFDESTGKLVEVDRDRDYDGSLDGWTFYEAGVPRSAQRDNNGDGKPDEWLRYGPDGRATSREVDRDGDGVRDAFYTYEGGTLALERHDTNGDGHPDRILHYEDGKLALAEEDTEDDGRTDTWTHYKVVSNQEVVERIEKDTTGDGKPDLFERYEQVAGRLQIKERGEDKNGDGEIDIRSIYENGKLKQRQISDPALLPL